MIEKTYLKKSAVHRAGWVMADPWTLIPNGYVRVGGGRILETGSGACRGGGPVMDHGPGLLMASPVNAHTHLELGALKGRVPFDQGFGQWVKDLLRIRSEESEENLVKGAGEGIRELMDFGCGVAGEISTLGLSRNAFLRSEMSGMWFQEFLGGGVPPLEPLEKKNGPLELSFAGHAPHTTSPDFLRALKKRTADAGLPFSIHVAEALEETEFITTGKGLWADFLLSRGIDFSGWGLPAESVVKHLDKAGILDSKTLAVHLINASPDDFRILAEKNVKACLCIRSNLNLHNKIPDLRQMLKAGIRPSLGTDSLASVSNLSMFDEMAAVSKNYPFLSPVEIIEMATVRGAEALGFESEFGVLTPGKKDTIVYIPAETSNPDELFERVIGGNIFAALLNF